MKEEVVNKLMEKALTYLNSAEAFAGSEIPKYIEELLNFKIMEHLINYFDDMLITLPLFLSAIIFACIVLFKKNEDGRTLASKSDEFVEVSLACLLLTGTLFSLSVFESKELVQAYKAYKAPRVYLVDYFKNGGK